MDSSKIPEGLSRRERDRKLRQNDFIQAAEQLFGSKGFQHSTMEEIAQLAEYATGTIYRYFASKEELYGALMHRKLEEYLERVEGAISGVEDPVEKLRVFLKVKIEFCIENRQFLHIYMKEILQDFRRLGAGLKEESAELHRALHVKLKEILQEGIGDGKIREISPDILATAFCGMTNEILIESLDSDRYLSDGKKLETEIWNLFSKGAFTLEEKT